MNPRLHCYTIPAESPFIPALARWILDNYGQHSHILPQTLVLLPNRRTCRSLREAFLEVTGGKPLLLPRIQPIGDIEDDILYYQPNMSLPAPILPLRRELLLTRMVAKFHGYGMEQSAELARQLARFMDDMAREHIGFDQLDSLVPEELSRHWQQTVDFLTIISKHWPAILEQEQASDPVAYRNQMLIATAEAWQQTPPDYPIIAAGSTGSQPATAMLLATIARLPQGHLILPALDAAMPEHEWEHVAETHPQFALKQLLGRIECMRSEVNTLVSTPLPHRTACLQTIFQPPQSTSQWTQTQLPLREGLNNISLLVADTLLDEARMIAIALREVLETPHKTAALITPDRQLARMTAAQLQRFDIEIDDSAGTALMDTPPASFLRLLIQMVSSRAAPSPLLALLRHPLAAVGVDTAQCRLLSRQLERNHLRGIRHTAGLSSLIHACKDEPELHALLIRFETAIQPLALLLSQHSVSLKELLQAHITCAERLADTANEQGSNRLWAGEAGNALATFMAELLEQSGLLDNVDSYSYAGLFDTLLAGHTLRPVYGTHPRLQILSPIEARLQVFDRVILGGLNEGTWPASPQADPWMSRPMRSDFGLPASERSIGQSAHDIYMLCHAPEVILSRSRKVEGTPTTPSRWLVRLHTLLDGMNHQLLSDMFCNGYYHRAKQLLDTPADIAPLTRPVPVPPLQARPRRLSVTTIDTWLRDPYMIYAKHILRLNRLDPLDKEPDSAEFGNVVHTALEVFAQRWPDALPDPALPALIECGKEAFSHYIDRPAVACLWWPRFEGMAKWFVTQEQERRSNGSHIAAELKGVWNFTVDNKPFTLTARIDRLEFAKDGSAILADYKTGSIPSNTDRNKGLATQLPLGALVALHGELSPLKHAPSAISGLEYWKLGGDARSCYIESAGENYKQGIDSWLDTTHTQLEGLIRQFDNPAQAYAAQEHQSLVTRYNDYEHLTRRQEWETL